MDSSNWIFFYDVTKYSASLLMIALGGLSIFLLKKDNKQNRLLSFYFIINAVVEMLSLCANQYKVFIFTYIDSLNHLLIITEVILIGLYFKSFLAIKYQQYLIYFMMIIVIIYDIYTIIKFQTLLGSTQYNSALLSALLCISGLMAFHKITLDRKAKRFEKKSNSIISGSFTLIYAILVIIFFIAPSIIQYSELASYQLFIFRNILIFIFLTAIGYGIWLKIKFTPNASLKP